MAYAQQMAVLSKSSVGSSPRKRRRATVQAAWAVCLAMMPLRIPVPMPSSGGSSPSWSAGAGYFTAVAPIALAAAKPVPPCSLMTSPSIEKSAKRKAALVPPMGQTILFATNRAALAVALDC